MVPHFTIGRQPLGQPLQVFPVWDALKYWHQNPRTFGGTVFCFEFEDFIRNTCDIHQLLS